MNDDLISRSALLEKVQFRLSAENHEAYIVGRCVEITRDLIKYAPAVDAVEVVRCKDCRHCAYDDVFGQHWCGGALSVRKVSADAFCSYGERREDG